MVPGFFDNLREVSEVKLRILSSFCLRGEQSWVHLLGDRTVSYGTWMDLLEREDTTMVVMVHRCWGSTRRVRYVPQTEVILYPVSSSSQIEIIGAHLII